MLTPFGAFNLVMRRAQQAGAQQDRVAAAWVSAVEDKEALDSMPVIMPLQKAYFERGLSVFGLPPGSQIGLLMGRPGGGEIQPAGACDGSFTREKFLRNPPWSGIRLKGGARKTSDGSTIDQFVATNLNLQVIGAGSRDVVYASATNLRDPLIIYGLLSNGQLCAVRTD